MSQPNSFNPYAPSIGVEISSGLDSIIGALPTDPQVTDLVSAVVNYVTSVYYPSATTQVQQEVQAVAYNAINSFRNSLVLSGNAMFNINQVPFIDLLIGSSMTANLAPDSVPDRISDIEDNIGTSELTVNEQQPLFLATTTGTYANGYWQTQVQLGSESAWIAYLSSNAGENYMNTLQWTVAAMNGALAGYGATPASLIEPTVNVVTNNMVSALIGALTVTAGKIIFNWIPRITKPLQLNIQNIGILNGNPPPIPAGANIDTTRVDTTGGVFNNASTPVTCCRVPTPAQVSAFMHKYYHMACPS